MTSALHALAGASPEVTNISARCVLALNAVLEESSGYVAAEAAMRAAALISLGVSKPGSEEAVLRAAVCLLQKIIGSLAANGFDESPPLSRVLQ